MWRNNGFVHAAPVCRYIEEGRVQTMKTWVYPGSFDPVTNGHIDIIKRAAQTCDQLVVGVLVNPSKTYSFSVQERIDMLKKVTKDMQNVVIDGFTGLLVDFLHKHEAGVIIKGLRAVSDYEYELQMAHLNKHVDNSVETIFMMAGLHYTYISSSTVKELGRYGADIRGLVPEELVGEIQSRLKG